MSTLDIVIPVHNRLPALKATLGAIMKQKIPPQWHLGIIICDDGSSPAVEALMKEIAVPSAWKNTSTHFRQSHQGIAIARNQALSKSKADIILFLGSDILLCEGALEAHCNFHDTYQEPTVAALGYIQWDPLLQPSPLMEWMMHGGSQNDIDGLLGKKEVDPRHYFYGSHLSLKRSLLNDTAFHSYVPYGWEDLDMGYQLKNKGIKLHVLKNARAFHHHTYSLHALYKRQETIGFTAPIFLQRVAMLEKDENHTQILKKELTLTLTRKIKVWLYRFLGIRLLGKGIMWLYGQNHALPALYKWIFAAEFWVGVEKSKRPQKQT